MTPFLLHLLRHGAPDQPGRMMGRTDCTPTEAGIGACLDQCDGLEIETLVSSDLRRASAVAKRLGAQVGLDPVVDARWRELDFGAWDGLRADEIDADPLGRFWSDPDAFPPPGGETWSKLQARVGSAIAALAPRPTLVVTHGGAMRAALACLCGFGLQQLWAFDLPYSSLLALKVWPGDRPSAQIVGLWP